FSSTFGLFPPPPVEVVAYWSCRMYLIAEMSFDSSPPVRII
ncbi:1131_t:CDS:1, partial [Gigaspora rosea]